MLYSLGNMKKKMFSSLTYPGKLTVGMSSGTDAGFNLLPGRMLGDISSNWN
jgi:hypothetical protein